MRVLKAFSRRPEWLLDVLLIAGLFFVGGVAILSFTGKLPYMLTLSRKPASPEEKMNVALPELTLPDVEGKPVSLASYRGKPLLLVFWSSHCHYCQQELPGIEKFHRQHPELGLLGIGLNDRKEGLAAYTKANGFTFQTLWDEKNALASTLKPNGTPNFYCVDPDGKVGLVHWGTGVLDSPEFKKWLRQVAKPT